MPSLNPRDVWRVVRPGAAPAALALLALVALLLVRQNRSLRDTLREQRSLARSPRSLAYLPAFRSISLKGDSMTVGERTDGGRQVLFVFRTTCPFCEASLPEWRRVAAVLDTLSQPHTDVIAIALDTNARALDDYVRRHELLYPIVRFPSVKFQAMYRASAVPATIVLNSEGRVVYAHLGVLDTRAVSDSVLAAVRYKSTTTASGVRAVASAADGVRDR